MGSNISVVVGAQYGSEGKGAIAGHLASTPGRPTVCVRVGGPNAGHTVIGNGPDGPEHAWRLQTVPVAAVTDHQADLVIAAGSEIDPAILDRETQLLEEYGHPVLNRLFIDGQATLLTPEHQQTETDRDLHAKIGSTGKGIGAARADRIMRTATLWRDYSDQAHDTAKFLNDMIHGGSHIVIEGTQGYGLGLHAGHYPQCTSNNARAIDFLSMAGVSPWQQGVDRLRVYAVARTHPIRVAGNSGPLKGETTWQDLGLDPELTTVTRKVRRVGEWDSELVRQAVELNGGSKDVRVCLTMLDHVIPEVAHYVGPIEGMPDRARKWVHQVEKDTGARVAFVGTGPGTVAYGEDE